MNSDRQWISCTALTVLSCTGAVAGLLLPVATAAAVDDALAAVDGGAFHRLAAVIATLVAASHFLAARYQASGTATLRRTALAHLLHRGLRRPWPVGDALSRLAVSAPDAASRPLTICQGPVGFRHRVLRGDRARPDRSMAGRRLRVRHSRSFAEFTMACQNGCASICARLTDALGGVHTIAVHDTLDRETGRILAPLPGLRTSSASMWTAQGHLAWHAGLLVASPGSARWPSPGRSVAALLPSCVMRAGGLCVQADLRRGRTARLRQARRQPLLAGGSELRHPAQE
ncbi:hypothetical protein ACIBG8_43115 [Nonomuraea sp. NPDC050556]|uniref:hypothetical protein n=1 Tax=Nonomuraea sp. NPDC050556 TaxID=3364369 RepID=UPI0037B579F7